MMYFVYFSNLIVSFFIFLIDECYERKIETLVVGAHGIGHTMKEKIKEEIHHIGSVTDYAVHRAPCNLLEISIFFFFFTKISKNHIEMFNLFFYIGDVLIVKPNDYGNKN